MRKILGLFLVIGILASSSVVVADTTEIPSPKQQLRQLDWFLEYLDKSLKTCEYYMDERNWKPEGIGITFEKVRGESLDYEIVVTSVFEHSPADFGWIKTGDIILEANNVLISSLSLEAIQKLMKGPKGTSVKLGTMTRKGGYWEKLIVRDVIYDISSEIAPRIPRIKAMYSELMTMFEKYPALFEEADDNGELSPEAWSKFKKLESRLDEIKNVLHVIGWEIHEFLRDKIETESRGY